MPSDVEFDGTLPFGPKSKNEHMIKAQREQTARTSNDNFAATLDREANELEALHVGVQRHLNAWRAAHESAILRLGAVMARIDAMVDEIERRRA